MAALRGLAVVTSLVRSLRPGDCDVFPRYIIPALQRFPNDREVCVRVAFAETLPKLALVARRFLDMAQALKQAKAVSETAGGRDGNDEDDDDGVAAGSSGISGGGGGGNNSSSSSSSSNKNNKNNRSSNRDPSLILVEGSYDTDLQELYTRFSNMIAKLVSFNPAMAGTGGEQATCLSIYLSLDLSICLPPTFLSDTPNSSNLFCLIDGLMN